MREQVESAKLIADNVRSYGSLQGCRSAGMREQVESA